MRLGSIAETVAFDLRLDGLGDSLSESRKWPFGPVRKEITRDLKSLIQAEKYNLQGTDLPSPSEMGWRIS